LAQRELHPEPFAPSGALLRAIGVRDWEAGDIFGHHLDLARAK
jgi:hypothetical protein